MVDIAALVLLDVHLVFVGRIGCPVAVGVGMGGGRARGVLPGGSVVVEVDHLVAVVQAIVGLGGRLRRVLCREEGARLHTLWI